MIKRLGMAAPAWWAISCTAAWGSFSTVIDVPPQLAPAAIGSDTQLNLGPGGVLPNSFAAGASDGSSTNVEVNVAGGIVGNGFNAYAGATVNVSGGELGFRFWTREGATSNITGGTFGRDVTCERGSIVNIFGGDFPHEIHAMFRSTVNAWGGNLSFFQAHDQAQASFFGSQFFVDGVELTGLTPGAAVTIPERDVAFSGTLVDGSSFSFMLTTAHPDQGGADVDHFSASSVLTATYVPTADFNLDFGVDGADLAHWSSSFGVGGGADADLDGDADGADFLAWQRQITPAATAVGAIVPEPAGAWPAALGGAAALARRRRRMRRPDQAGGDPTATGSPSHT